MHIEIINGNHREKFVVATDENFFDAFIPKVGIELAKKIYSQIMKGNREGFFVISGHLAKWRLEDDV